MGIPPVWALARACKASAQMGGTPVPAVARHSQVFPRGMGVPPVRALIFRLEWSHPFSSFNPFLRMASGVLSLRLRLCSVLSAACALAGASAAPLEITQDIIPPGECGRPLHRPMSPAFITIHSTDNTARSADAWHHARAMKNGFRARYNRSGFLTWHFTVDDHSIFQSLPTTETGEHADYEGDGNRSSIGIEMCVNRGSDIAGTVDRTARLTAQLMRRYRIPLNHVVPHMYWRRIRYRDGRDLGHKQCPRILLERGQLGTKWNAFIAKVALYARRD